MAINRFIGKAATAAQVDSFTPANVEVDDVFTLTMTGVDGTTAAVSFTATAATVANVTAGLTTAWNNSTDALIATLTASDQTTYLDLTADTAGTGFTVVPTAVDGGGTDTQTFVRANLTPNGSVKEWANADNWSAGEIPGASASADVYVEDAEIIYGLNQSTISNTLTSLNITSSQIGSNAADGYSPTYLQIKATTVNINQHNGPGTRTFSSPVNIDTGSVASTINVFNSGTNSPTTLPSVNIKAANASTNINWRKGKVGLASFTGESSTVGALTIDYIDIQKSDVDGYIGDNVTISSITKNGGNLQTYSCPATITNNSGDMTIEGTDAITTLTCNSGTVTSNTTGTITTAIADKSGVIDFSKSSATRYCNTAKVGKNSTIKYDPAVVTTSAPATLTITPVETSGTVSIKGQ